MQPDQYIEGESSGEFSVDLVEKSLPNELAFPVAVIVTNGRRQY